jgi:AcrR family transcriptional regulator
MKQEPSVEQRILESAVELIIEHKAFDKVSMRKIAEKAGVAVSMVNYHFQTKEKLINLAIQSYIGRIIENSHSRSPSARNHLKSSAAFLSAHPGVSRVSILQDLQHPHEGDNTQRVEELVLRQLESLDDEGADSVQVKLRAIMQVATIQHLFLRSDLYAKSLNLDFSDKDDRDQIMDLIIDIIHSNTTTQA